MIGECVSNPFPPIRQKTKPQAKLTTDEVLKIFLSKENGGRGKVSVHTLSKKYGVSTKAVRDIWNGRTWNRETNRLDSKRIPKDFKPIGRPKGSRDKVPRKGIIHQFESMNCLNFTPCRCIQSHNWRRKRISN